MNADRYTHTTSTPFRVRQPNLPDDSARAAQIATALAALELAIGSDGHARPRLMRVLRFIGRAGLRAGDLE